MAKKKDDEYLEHHVVVPLNEDVEKKKAEAKEKEKELRDTLGPYEAVVYTIDGKLKPTSELSYEEMLVEITRCKKDPIYFIETYLTVFDQTQGEAGEIVPFKLFPFQKELIKAYQKHRFNIANKYRQAGISTTTSAYLAWYVAFNENRKAAIIANKLETARDEMMADTVNYLENCPDWLVPQATVKDTQKLKRYDNGSELAAFSSKGLRGFTPTLLFWDETAWTENSDVFWTSARPTLQTGGRCIFVSTPNGLDPVFYKTFQAARQGDSSFNAVELWWFNDPRYIRNKDTGEIDLRWVKNKKKNDEVVIDDTGFTKEKRIQLSDDGWEPTSSWYEEQVAEYNGDMRKVAQELLCSFLGSGDNFIAEEYIKECEENQKQTPIRQEYEDKNMWIWEDPEPEEDYVIVLDVSSGHGDDNGCVNVFKIKETSEEKVITKNGRKKKIKIRRVKSEQVAEYYEKVTPQQLGYIGYHYGKKYNNAYMIIDITGGYGVSTIDKVLELGYENIHYSEVQHKPSRDRLHSYVKTLQKTTPDGKTVKVDLVPGLFIGQNRGIVLQEMERAIRMGDMIVRSIRVINEMKTFVTVPGNRVADHKRSFHDDSLMTLAYCSYVTNFEMTDFKSQKERTKKMLDAFFKLENDEVVTKNEQQKNSESFTKGTRTPDYRVSKRNPYGANSWMFKGLK